jgi:hypothetical protein
VSNIPKSIAQGVFNLGGMKLRTHVLDNGQRVIDANDMEKFFELMMNGEVAITEADAMEFARFMHGADTKGTDLADSGPEASMGSSNPPKEHP